MVEKLSKALEGLKNIQFTSSLDDSKISKKEKMFFCVLAADVVVSLKSKSTQNLPVIIENMINLCNDKDSDVRMVADESLNRIIMSLSQLNMLKVQVELRKIIKKNGPARCVRAAISRFGQLSSYLRPSKGKDHVQALLPALIEITKREEESIHETLASSLENIFKVLGVFVKDNALKGLIKAFLHNLSSNNPVIRRCSASSIITIVQYCRKPLIFNCFVLNSILDCVVPVCEENSTDLILGVLVCLRLLLPTLINVRNEEGISGSFGLRKKPDESLLSVDRLIQAYELCLHYTNSKDHNVVAAALETLNQILQNPPHQLESFFLSPAGFSRSYIHSAKENRLWSRSGSEMSVAFSLPAMDETLSLDDDDITSHLSTGEPFRVNLNLTKSKDEAEQTEEDFNVVDSLTEEKPFDEIITSRLLDIDSDTESIETSELNVPEKFLMRIESLEKEVENSELDCSRVNSHDDLHSPAVDRSTRLRDPIDVGNFTDAAVPLIYCTRHLTASFLLDGTPNSLKNDRTVRVSIKSLALCCLSAIIKLYPLVMSMNLSKNQTEGSNQEISDVLLFSEHSDPQIRGNISVLVGSFINSVLIDSKNHSSDCLNSKTSKLNSKNLIKIILQSLQDKSSVCTRLALTAFNLCINNALYSVYNSQFLSVLEYLPVLTNNSYWLVKVKLVEVLSDLPYVCLSELTKFNRYQEEVVDFVLLPLLGDEDARVRTAAAEALVRIVPALHNENSSILEFGRSFTAHLTTWLRAKNDFTVDLCPCSPFSYALARPKQGNFNKTVEDSLSVIVAKLTCSLLVPKSKHFLFGYLEALKLLSEKYPTTVYSKGWNCEKSETDEDAFYLTSSLIGIVLSHTLTSPFGMDLTAYSNATLLLGNLFAGHSISNLKPNCETSVSSLSETDSLKLWDVFKSECISQIAEEILTHLLKILNLYSRLIEEVSLNSVSEASTALNSFLPLLSPIRKQEKKTEEKSEDKKSRSGNNCKQSTLYDKLSQLLKNAHTNYRVSLDSSVSDKFLDLLKSTLHAMSVVLEVATFHETGRCAEEILSYLRSVVTLLPSPAVVCAIQLLKTLFGTNLASNWDGKKFPGLVELQDATLFEIFFHLPIEFLSDKIRRRADSNLLNCEALSGPHRRSERKTAIRNSDKTWLATYIRLFEPMVVKSLQLYTVTGNVELQANVLRLLNQLVQLRINYCMLDEKQVFLDFVLKQFDLIEHGQIPGVEVLLPQIFKFLILLSYEKQHSKPVMSIPKILQLCDGLMASDQPVQTHCIPALVPVVEDIFLFRRLITSPEEKELETQREVLLSMLLRLVEFSEVMDLLSMILNESKAIEEKEKWKRWSRQVIDTLIPLLTQDRLRVETTEAQNSFTKLMSSLSPNVLRPINPLLKVLFVEPTDYGCPTSVKRWLSKVTVLLETILFVKEDALLNRLEETSPCVNLTNFSPTGNFALTDPFNVKSFFQTYESSETVARFILKVVYVVASKIEESCAFTAHLQRKLSMFFVCTFYILKSGTFHRIKNSLQNLLLKEPESVEKICFTFLKLRHFCPVLTCQFSYFLTLLSYCDENYWREVVGASSTLSSALVQCCGVISLSDYMCDNLSDAETLHFLLKNSVEKLVVLSNEIPVKELLLTMHRRKSDWNLFLEAVSQINFQNSHPRFVEKLLRLLELTESCHSGALLKLIADMFLESPRLSLSLLAGSIARRQVEYLLTLPEEKVLAQIDSQTFNGLMESFKKEKYSRRHSTLWGLLSKLNAKVFNSAASDFNGSDRFYGNVENSKSIELGEEWYFAQVLQRCCQKGETGGDVPLLLSKLNNKRILEIMNSLDFNLKILKKCLAYPENLRDLDNEKRSRERCDVLFKASEEFLWQNLNQARKELQGSSSGDSDRNNLNCSEVCRERFWELADCLVPYLQILQSDRSNIQDERATEMTEFMIFCFKMMTRSISGNKLYPKRLETGLKCCSAILKNREGGKLELTRESVEACVNHFFILICHLVPRCRLNTMLKGKDSTAMSETEKLDFFLNLISYETSALPAYLFNCIRDFVVSLCRLPGLNSGILKVPEGSDPQDVDLLRSFISRFSVIGWSSRQQFEEIWVALLSVLGFNTQGDVPLEENGFIVQASVVAVEGITTLLKNTMMDAESGKLIHHGRDFLSMKNVYEKLPLTSRAYKRADSGERAFQFVDNLEIPQRGDKYFHGLLSVEYLWTAVKQISNRVDLYERHCEELYASGLDLPSCIHLLTELYNQWISQASPDIRIVSCSLKSSVVISDLFTDIGQFQWLLNFCLRVDEIVIPEDTVVLPLVILGSCKAAAIVLPSDVVCEKIKKLMLRSKSFPCRMSSVEGLLYLLQSYTVCYAVNHTALPPPGSTFQKDEANFVANIVDAFLPVALDLIQEFRLERKPVTEEYERCHWSLIFYLLQHYQSSLGHLKEELLNFILTVLSGKNCPDSIVEVLTRGTQRLVLTTVLDENFRDQLLKVSLEIISNGSVATARNGLQLLSVLSFLDKRVKDIRQLVTGQEDPEKVMRDMEKINVLFEKLKKSYPKEAEVIGDVTAYVLIDFAASDVLTKVIQEFLSSHQPHQKILGSLLFEVFQRADQNLVEDWLVFSLPSFIQGLPIAMSVWTLNFFFVSASSEPWLRSLFPLIQCRTRMAEVQDKGLLCLSALHFYKQLKYDSQRKSFVEAFRKAADIDSFFHDLLSTVL